MNHASRMRGVEGGERLLQNEQRVRQRHQLPAGAVGLEHFVEGFTVEQFHHDGVATIRHLPIGEHIDDAAVTDGIDRASLGDQSLNGGGVFTHLGAEHLDGDPFANGGLLTFVDDAHASGAEAAFHEIPDHRTADERVTRTGRRKIRHSLRDTITAVLGIDVLVLERAGRFCHPGHS